MTLHRAPLLAIFIGPLLAATALTSGNVSAQDVSALDQVRDIYQRHTPENFDDGGPISHYVWKNFVSFYPHATIARTSDPRPLQVAASNEVAAFPVVTRSGASSLADYVSDSPLVDAVIVLAGGRVVFEAYPRMQPYERHLGWSVTKVMLSTALAVLESQGKVDLSLAVESYVPELSGTAWQGTSLRDVVNMASGIACLDSDGYQNTETCIYRLEQSLGLTAPVNPPQSTLQNLTSMRRHRPAGQKYEYVSANTFVIGQVVENVTGKPLWSALQDLVWDRIGAEADAMLMISPEGIPYSFGGVSARLRDVARFGQLFTSGDQAGVVDSDHLADLRSDNGVPFDGDQLANFENRFPGDPPSHAAWQWDMIWPDGAMFKHGYSGQGIYVDPDRDLVIAWFGTDSTDNNGNELLPIARRLATSGLFDD